MIRKNIIEKIFSGASIQRWNDHIRPLDLTELDKQAHKAVIAYMLARFEQIQGGRTVDMQKIAEGCIFEFLPRLILTDIKAPVFHRLMQEKGDEIKDHVYTQLKDELEDIQSGLSERFQEHLKRNTGTIENRIINAAHYLATQWEFKMIYNLSQSIHGIEATKERINNQLEDHYDLIGVQKLSLGQKFNGFIDLCGQMRFQQRWAQTPRVPKTSVLGHTLFVAILSYFTSLEAGLHDRRTTTNFYAALFHDLPEALTRDIVSPVKKSVSGLEELIEDIEKHYVREQLLPLLPDAMHAEIEFFVEEPFQSRLMKDGEVKHLSAEELAAQCEDEDCLPVDGPLVKACDELAAFIEAAQSLAHGLQSEQLRTGKSRLYDKYKDKKILGISFVKYFDYFNG